MPTKTPSDQVSAFCLVLRAVPYGEADAILTLFARDVGLLSARAYGVKSLKSSVRAACQPFCTAEFEFYRRGDRLSVKAAAVHSTFSALQNDYTAYICGCIILELTEKVLRYADEFEQLFRLTVGSLSMLNSGAAAPKRVLLFFLVRLTHLLGVFPVLTTCAVCGARISRITSWSAAEGGAVCPDCARTQPVITPPPGVIRCLGTFGRGQLRELAADLTDPAVVDAACGLLMDYLRAQYDLRLRTATMLPPG